MNSWAGADGRTEIVEVGAAGIRLGQLLKLVGAAETGGAVKELLEQELVRVNDATETRRGAQLRPGDVVTVGEGRFELT